jgi:hypothetical protein
MPWLLWCGGVRQNVLLIARFEKFVSCREPVSIKVNRLSTGCTAITTSLLFSAGSFIQSFVCPASPPGPITYQREEGEERIGTSRKD